MTYTKQQWVDGQTKVDAQHLNHIEQGIYDISIQPGVPGEQGEPGKDGTTPLLKLTDSALQVSYDNGSQWTDLLPLSAITGPQGQAGEGFAIYKTYASIEAMQADAANVQQGKFVLISSTEDDPDNGKLYVKGETEFTYLSDLSGAQGIQGPQGEPGANGVTPVITVEAKSVESTEQASVVKTGSDTNPHFTFSIPKGKDAELPDNLVTYSDFTYGDQQRKTIQLANYDSISGIGTDGQGYNIAMVSKWDKVDLGTPSLTMNLNSKDGLVQINDEKVVATTDQIPDVSGFATTEALTQGLANKQDKGDYALKSELPEVPETLPNPNALTIKYNGQVAFTYDGSEAETGNFVVNAQTVPMSDSDSKTIAQALSEKQAVGDYATNEIVEAEFASYDKTIKAYVDDKLTAVYTYKGSVASEEELPQEHAVGDVWNIESTGANVAWDGEKWDNLGATIDLSGYATTEAVTTAIAGIGVCNLGNFSSSGAAELKAAQAGTFDNPANKIFVYTVKNAQTGVIINNITGDGQATQFINWNGAASKRTVTADSASSWVQTDVNFLANKGIMLTKLRQLTTESDSETVKAALTGGAGQQPITASDLDTCFTKDWTIREYSMQFAGFKVGYTGSDYVLTYVGVPTPAASPVICSIRIAITNEGVYSCVTNPVYGTIATTANLQEKADKVHTHEIADVNGLSDALAAKADTSAIPETLPNPNALTIKYNGQTAFTYDGSQAETGNFVVNATTVPVSEEDPTTVKDYIDEQIENHSHYTLPVSANIPLVTMQDKVYTEAEICGWFGAEDVTGLKGLMAQPHQFVIRYNISSGSLGYHSYQIPFQYLYVAANNKSLKGIAVGLNPNNDTVSKIVLEANLDGTIIEGNSNVKVTYTSLE